MSRQGESTDIQYDLFRSGRDLDLRSNVDFDLLQPLHSVNDRVLSANNLSLENVDYATAVQQLRDSSVLHLHIKRRVVLPASLEPQILRMTLTKGSRKEGTYSGKYLLKTQPMPRPRTVTISEEH